MDQVMTVFTQCAHYVLIWVGFGTLVGLLAKAIGYTHSDQSVSSLFD